LSISNKYKVWFTADTHFGHANIVRYIPRPFQTVDEMNEELIKRWNKRVGKKDMVYHLGDFCFKSRYEDSRNSKWTFQDYLEQLNGTVILFEGNHDPPNVDGYPLWRDAVIQTKIGAVYCSHHPGIGVPMDIKKLFHGHAHLHGPVINIDRWNKTFVDVGVDHHDYYPISIDEISILIKQFKKYHKAKRDDTVLQV